VYKLKDDREKEEEKLYKARLIVKRFI
jgi:hypothetical protein